MLEERRLHGNVIVIFQLISFRRRIYHFYMTVNCLRGHGNKLDNHQSMTLCGPLLFNETEIDVWNYLPEHIIFARSTK